MHDYHDLITLFHQSFFEKYNTKLIKGEDEPLYLPADEHCPYHRIIFAHGFFASALHECSHWLIAGEERHKLVDFGYWYEPDGRTAELQELFQKVESKPQAVEWILSQAAGYRFQISVDNLNGPSLDTGSFNQAIYQQIQTYYEKGLPERIQTLRKALCEFYKTDPSFNLNAFDITKL